MKSKRQRNKTAKAARIGRTVARLYHSDGPVIEWTVVEPGPDKHWWWYIGFTLFALWLAGLLILLRQWSPLACELSLFAAILVIYRRKPKRLSYSLSGRILKVDRDVLDLSECRAFTTQVTQSRDGAQRRAILLLPRRRFGYAYEVTPPNDEGEAQDVIAALLELLPYDEAGGYQGILRAIDRIARWLGLS